MSKLGPKGIIMKIRKEGTRASIGANKYMALSAFKGSICSLRSNLTASATVCRIPKGPALSGPTLDCIPATNFLSSQISKIVFVNKSPKTKKALVNPIIKSIDT
jgi:hypothetical protein